MDENKMARGMVLGFLAGSVIGGIIALLYAPKSGKELRNDIKLKKDEFLDDTSEYMQIAKEKANEKISSTKEKIGVETDRIKDAFKAGIDAYNEEKNKVSS